MSKKKRKNRNSAERISHFEHMRVVWKENRLLAIVYVVLRLSVIGVGIAQFLSRRYDSVFLCILTLVLLSIPSFIENRIHVNVPDTLEIIVLLFIWCAEILGEISEYYVSFKYWDTMLHTVNGFLCAAIGFAMIDLLNRREMPSFKLSPIFVAVVAFCFSMTIGVLWEFFEFFMDSAFALDMQKDTFVTAVNTVLLNPEGRNTAVHIPIESVIVNGQEWPGYVDIGLIDTMKDLFVNFIGAVVFSVIGYIYIKNRGKKGNTFVERFVMTFMTKEQIENRRRMAKSASGEPASGTDGDDV